MNHFPLTNGGGSVDLPLTHKSFALTTSNLVGCQVYFYRSPKLAELMKQSLYGNHGNHSTTKCFFAISRKNVVKNHPISKGSCEQNFQFQDPKLCDVIGLSLLTSKIIFLWACQILGRDKWENRNKTGETLNFPGFCRAISTVCP